MGILQEPSSAYLPSLGASGEDIFVLSAASILENLSQEEQKNYLEAAAAQADNGASGGDGSGGDGSGGVTQNPYRYTLFDMYVHTQFKY